MPAVLPTPDEVRNALVDYIARIGPRPRCPRSVLHGHAADLPAAARPGMVHRSGRRTGAAAGPGGGTARDDAREPQARPALHLAELLHAHGLRAGHADPGALRDAGRRPLHPGGAGVRGPAGHHGAGDDRAHPGSAEDRPPRGHSSEHRAPTARSVPGRALLAHAPPRTSLH